MAQIHCQLLPSFPLGKTFMRPTNSQLPLSRPRAWNYTYRLVQAKSTVTIPATSPSNQTINRRSGNYGPPIWTSEYIQSLTSEFMGDEYTERIIRLKGGVRVMFDALVVDPLEQLELIDVLERLGVSYHFDDKINKILEGIYNRLSHVDDMWKKNNLYATALEFRLLRHHGFNIPQEVFNGFRDDITGKYKDCLYEDTKGMLALYEASYLSIEGETILEEARDFTFKHLQEWVKWSKDEHMTVLVNHALELPLHWRVQRLEARWFIDFYRTREDLNSILLELAISDFNKVQSIHQEDLKHASSWWSSTGFGEKLSFARDRLMHSFLWTSGIRFEPQFGYFRRMMTKVIALITAVDDIYDVYGTLDELELFTNAVDRWDIDSMDQLPDYMKVCYLTLYNATNEMAFDALKEQGVHVIHYLRTMWADLCKCYLLEAKWYHNKHRPTLQEYMENARISISGPIVLVHAYVFTTRSINMEVLEILKDYPNILRWSGIIFRLADDLGTSSDELKRGDTPKSIQCYMNETGVSEKEAREHIRYLMSETWKKMNEEVRASSALYPPNFFGTAMNLVRMSQNMYHDGDGHGVEENAAKDRVLSILIQPIYTS